MWEFILSNFLIGLREGLEATLVVSILIAFLVKTDRHDRLPYVWSGVAAPIVLSVCFGALLTFTSTSLLSEFSDRELFGGVTSIIAVGFVTWMLFWMRRTARHLKADLTGRLEAAVAMRAVAVAVAAFLAVAREGLETTLFFWAAAQQADDANGPLIGFVAGIAVSVAIGWLLYRSAVALNLAKFFTWTGAGLVLVSAGVLAYGIHDLQEAEFLPGLDALAFNVTEQVPPDSWYGTLLKGVFNFSPATTVLEAIVWLAYVIPVLILFLWPARRQNRPEPVPQQASA